MDATTTQNCDGLAFFDSLAVGDEEGCRALLQRARELRNASLLQLCETLTDAFHRVGDAWECDQLTVFREHVASRIGDVLLQDLRNELPSQAANAPVAFGCAPEKDPYRLPTLMVELVLRDLGWAAQSLGSNLPLELVTPAIRELRPKLCWVSVSHVDSEDRLREQLTHLGNAASRQGAQVICGGQGLSEDFRRQNLGVTFLTELSDIGPFLEQAFA